VLSFRIDEHRCLRLLEETDANELYAVVDANREFLARWMPWPDSQTRESTLEFIRSSRKQLADNQGFQVAIVDDGRIVGVLGFYRLDWENRSTSVGYWIAESSQRQGTVTRAVRALTDHAFRTWKLNRVEIRAGVDNVRSRAIPARLGFKEEGVLRQVERVGDRYVDHVVYAMLAADWDTRSS
jgi:ribosomal-protein-serine acetyltransferase